MSAKRNGQVELLRFVFAMVIMLRHASNINLDGSNILLRRGALAVEFFFLVSGYLMAASAYKSSSTGNLSLDTYSYIKRKYLSLMPYLPIATIAGLCCTFISSPVSKLYQIIERLYRGVFEVLLIRESGISTWLPNSPTWYLSVMVISMIILYPICRKYFDMFVRVIAPILGIMIIGMINLRFGSLLDPSKEILGGTMYKGLPRGFAEICLGASCFPVVQALAQKNLSKWGKALVSVGIFSTFACSIVFMQCWSKGSVDTFVLVLLWIGIVLAFSHQDLFARYFDNKYCYWLGKFSLSLYLAHFPIAKLVAVVFQTQPLSYRFCIYFVLAFANALFIHILSGLLKKHSSVFHHWWKNKLLAE